MKELTEGIDRSQVAGISFGGQMHGPVSYTHLDVYKRQEEMHSKVEYIVAHGISTTIEGKKAIIGSSHFVFEDEKCTIPEGMEEKFKNLPNEYSHLYLAIEGSLAAVICIEDPLREEAPAVVKALKKAGFSKVVMMTGDSERTARAVAARVGVDEYYSEVLPEDKALSLIHIYSRS